MLGSIRLLYLKGRLLVVMVNKFLVVTYTGLGSSLISLGWCHFTIPLLDTTFVLWYAICALCQPWLIIVVISVGRAYWSLKLLMWFLNANWAHNFLELLFFNFNFFVEPACFHKYLISFSIMLFSFRFLFFFFLLKLGSLCGFVSYCAPFIHISFLFLFLFIFFIREAMWWNLEKKGSCL